MKKVEVTIRLEESAGADESAVTAALEKAGLSNISHSKRFRTIHGEIDEAKQDDLKRIKGVASVRASQTFKALGS